jgi:HKD family nuclease
MTDNNVLEDCLREGFINYNVKADKRYVPRIVTNNARKKTKVLDTILSQLTYCNEF